VRTSGLHGWRFASFCSLTGLFSPTLCTTSIGTKLRGSEFTGIRLKRSSNLTRAAVWVAGLSEGLEEHQVCVVLDGIGVGHGPLELFQDALLLIGRPRIVVLRREDEVLDALNNQLRYFVFQPVETINRVCLAMELEPAFVDVAVRRWEAFTGKKALLLSNGRSFEEVAAERLISPGPATCKQDQEPVEECPQDDGDHRDKNS